MSGALEGIYYSHHKNHCGAIILYLQTRTISNGSFNQLSSQTQTQGTQEKYLEASLGNSGLSADFYKWLFVCLDN